MTDIFHVFSIIFNYLIVNWIAIVSLAVSIYIAFSNNTKLDVVFRKETEWIYAILLDDGRSITNDSGLIHTNIKIINTSNNDLSYFDLKVFNEKNNEELSFYNESQMNPFNDLKNSKAISFLDSDKSMRLLNLPQADFGIIKAREVTSLDIVVSPDIQLENMFILFKVTKRKPLFRKVKYGYVNSPYETYAESVPVDVSQKLNYEKFLSFLQNE